MGVADVRPRCTQRSAPPPTPELTVRPLRVASLVATLLALSLTACGADDTPAGDEPAADDAADDAADGTPAADGDDSSRTDGDGSADAGDDGGLRDDRDELGAPGDPGPVADLDEATAAAVADLAASEGVGEDTIEVVESRQVTWPDGAVGCPEPGGMYTQALVPGYRIVLAVDGVEVTYTGGEGRVPARCDDPGPTADEGT